MDDLRGKRVLVTGSSSGIGAAVARRFAASGAVVTLHCNTGVEAAQEVMADIAATGGTSYLVQGDVSASAENTRIVNEAAEAMGGLDILVNNAGSMVRRVLLHEIDDAIYDRVLNLNVRSYIMAIKAAAPLIKAAGGGSVINTSSIAGRNGGSIGTALYGSAKAFVSNLTRNMAKELAPDGIRVNAVSPGVIQTQFHDRFSTPEFLETTRKSIPLQRLGTVAECAGTYVYLASEGMSGYVTGQVIEVNGGQYMP